MSEFDNQYFERLHDINKPRYDWERQIINLGCNVADIDISNASKIYTKEEQKEFSILVHEYIHFLQNFSTAWGYQCLQISPWH